MKDDNEVIYLEPNVPDSLESCEGRTWCQDNVWDKEDYDGVSATQYIRGDIVERLTHFYERKIDKIELQIKKLKGEHNEED